MYCTKKDTQAIEIEESHETTMVELNNSNLIQDIQEAQEVTMVEDEQEV